ncbi:site-specific integrase [Dysgonomonas sp. HDW5B]|uniref:site-specific integrase n=1 Tax=Dysgonomonas sp. HDW5B TaxID=2714927 RepID=UPI00140CFF1E|nr:site-specific integrase [Dysgonomonas sp. HDW5B]QIK54474.1 site-specific integrase [Dysgonomonas sp. HDW5B]
MKQETFNVLFFLKKNRIKANGEAPISVRITVNGQYFEIYIKRSIPVDQWDQPRGRAKGKSRIATETNLYIEAIRSKIFQIHRELESDGRDITVETVRNKYFGVEEERKTLLQVFTEHNTEARSLIGKGYVDKTVQRFETTARYLSEFIKSEYNLSDIALKELDLAFIRKFDVFLKVEKNCAQNSAITRLKNLKKITRIAFSNDWMQKDPFVTYRFKFDETNPEFLSKEELDTLIQKEFPIQRLEIVRDIFAFCCFTGLAFTDIQQLKPEHLVKDNDGSMWIRKNRQKTKNMCNIPLLNTACQLIEKYKNHPECQKKNIIFPVQSNQRMNSYLKEIADVCGISKKLTTHVARHTCATVVMLANNVSLKNVAKILGHSNTRTTEHYAKVLDSSILRDVKNVDEKFANLNII